MDRRTLAVAAVALLALGAWWATRPAAAPPQQAGPARRASARLARDGGAETVEEDAATRASEVCADHWLALPAGSELRYVMSVTSGNDTQSADYRLRLDEVRTVALERVESWLATIALEGADEPLETRISRRCSDAAGAEEWWMGLDFAGLSELKFQGWRWPARLHAGMTFGGELRRSMLDQTLSAQRQHRVLGVESVSTPAGSFDAWHVEVTDRASGRTEIQRGDLWVNAGVGLVRLLQPTTVGTLRLELAEITLGDE